MICELLGQHIGRQFPTQPCNNKVFILLHIELASKKYGTTVANIRQIMISKINNIVKVIRAKERLSVDKKD